jgi:hypothetical protein
MINVQPFEARNGFYRAQLHIADSIDALKVEPPPRDDSIAIAIGDVAAAIAGVNATIQNLDHTESDNVVALYAVGFGPHGGVSEHSATGHWIRKAWSLLGLKTDRPPTICDISTLTGPRTDRLEQALRDTRDGYDDFVALLSDGDIARFLSLAGDVCSKIGPPPSGTPNPEPATA